MNDEPATSADKQAVAYLGPRASYSHQATLQAFPPGTYNLQPCVDIPDIFQAVEDETTHLGVVPFENSTNGSVLLSLDLFCDRKNSYSNISVCSELFLPIHHCLLANPRTSLQNVNKIYSHPQAFGQCERFLGEHLKGVERVNVTSTSKAAEMVRSEDGAVAIASKVNMELLDGLHILQENIEDEQNNTTRFLVVRHSQPLIPSLSRGVVIKVFVAFTVASYEPGALSNVLNVFKGYSLNLTSLHSRPTLVEPWTYVFLIEFEVQDVCDAADRAVKDMERFCTSFRVWGGYEKRWKTVVSGASRSVDG